jgi:branched-chain amino acid transport system ATP-binding protein
MIQVENVTKRFGGLTAVNDCSLTIRNGTITGLIGPNGAGKSTLFNIISGFEKSDSGRISLNDEDVTNWDPHHLFQRGLIRTFQVPHEFNRMTVLENLMIIPAEQIGENVFNSLFRPRRVHAQERDNRQRALDVMDFLQLGHLKNELAGNLSGGQKKLLELGKTMMADARFVLLDEPGAGVNRTLLRSLAADIKRLNSELGYTFCIVEHDMDLITDLCDPVIVMAQGKVLAEGSMADLRKHHEVRQAYLGEVSEEPAHG